MPFPNMTPVEKIEHALRTERDALRAAGDTTAANAINTYLQQADETSKLRLIDILTREPPPGPSLRRISITRCARSVAPRSRLSAA